MDFGEMFRVLGRRWRVSVPALLLTVLATVAMYVRWPTTYQSSAELSLIASRTLMAQPGSADNAYLGVGGLGPLAGILTSYLSSDQALQKLQALGVTDAFTASVPAFAAGPFITISLTGKDPAVIRQSMPTAIRFTQQQLQFLQESPSVRTPSKGLVRAVVIAQPSAPKPLLKTKIELVAGVAIVGFIMLVLLSFSAEARATRRAGNAVAQESYDSSRGRNARYRERQSVSRE